MKRPLLVMKKRKTRNYNVVVFLFSRRQATIGPAKQAITFFEAQIKATKDAWTLPGIHCSVVEDIRKLIAKLIWD